MIDELPDPTPDLDSQPFWDGLAAGELRLQSCNPCGALRWPARAICNRCGSFEHEWRAVEHDAIVASWIRTHQVFAPAWKDRVPYVVVQVSLVVQPDIRMIGGWQSERDPIDREPVEARFVRRPSGTTVLNWAPRFPSERPIPIARRR
jgi:uncharacterized protein